MINRKCIELIEKIVSKKDKVTIKSLAEEFEVSERTIRYNLEKIEIYLTKNKVGNIKRVSKGELEITNIQGIREHLKELKTAPKDEDLVQSEREEHILIDLIFKNSINLKELSERLNVSRTTIKSDLNELLKKMNKNSIELIVEHKKGLIIVGEEEEVRKEFLNLIIRHFSEGNIKKLIEEKLQRDYEKKFKNLILKMEEKINSSITDEAYSVISYYLVVSVGRIMSGKKLEKISNESFLEKTLEYNLLELEMLELENEFGISFGKTEKLKLSDYFQGSHIYNPKFSYYENWVSMELLVQKIIENFSYLYKEDFIGDSQLFTGILNHIKPLIYRLKNNQKLENTIYLEVIESYPELFYKVKESLEVVEEFIEMSLSKDEIAFLVMHFKGAIDRKATLLSEKKKILVVCGLGYGTSNLLAQQLLDNYEVEIVDVIPAHRFESIEKKIYEIIVTTISSDFFNTDKKVVEVTPLLNEKDKENLKRNGFINKNKKISLKELMEILESSAKEVDKKQLKFQILEKFGDKVVNDIFETTELSKFLPLENIKFEVEVKSWQDAVRKGGDILLEKGDITEEYIKNMIETVDKYGSYIVIAPEFAIPHSRNSGEVIKSSASLIKLKEPVVFPKGKRVSIIFTFSSVDNKEHLQSLKELTELIGEKNFLENLADADSEDEIYKKILGL